VGVIPVGATVNVIVNIATYAAVQAPTQSPREPISQFPDTLFTDLRPSRAAKADE
jgi:hypothetical protein